MKKSVVIIIAIIYIASIVSINFFGMKMSVYNEQIPVERIECTNISDPERGIVVDEKDGKKRITITYNGPATTNPELTGTYLFLETRVYPDNANSKRVRYQYHFTSTNASFHKDNNGEEKGLILFTGLLGTTPITLVSTDGRNITTTILVRVVAPQPAQD